MWDALLTERSHRPFPLPDRPFAMTMTWKNLLFTHWPMPIKSLRQALPAVLPLDTFDGRAWVSIVTFAMSNVGPRFANQLPWVSRFLELNVRTYVTIDGKPGVYFFGLDASNRLAVKMARILAHLRSTTPG